MIGDVKTCSHCQTAKIPADFYRNRVSTDGLQSWCKACHIEDSSKRRRSNPERYRQYARQARERIVSRNPHYYREQQWRLKYGLTREEYQARLAAQGGVCAICKHPERGRTNRRTGKTRLLAVDHDHHTGKVRGLLCGDCNSALGWLGDDIKLLEAAQRYMKENDW